MELLLIVHFVFSGPSVQPACQGTPLFRATYRPLAQPRERAR